MISETINAVKNAENIADKIINDAKSEAIDILDKAKKNAISDLELKVKNAKKKSKNKIELAEKLGNEEIRRELEGMEEQIKNIENICLKNRNKAVALTIDIISQ